MMSTNNSETHFNWIDVSVPLREGMVVCPGDIKVEIDHRHFIQHMDGGTNSSIHMGVHTGTHMDAPRHFFAKGKSIDQMPFDTTIGPARHNLSAAFGMFLSPSCGQAPPPFVSPMFS